METRECPECGRIIDCDASHSLRFGPQIIGCASCPSGKSPVVVAVEHQGTFYDSKYFLRDPSKNGILHVETDEELRAFEVMRYEASSEEPGFISHPEQVMRIKWVNGDAIGFYTDYPFPTPRLSHIYVRPEFRGTGYAENMVDDFLISHPTGGLEILQPNQKVRNLLKKMGPRAKRIHPIGGSIEWNRTLVYEPLYFFSEVHMTPIHYTLSNIK